jgi:GLPGLI family protein
MKRLKTTLIVLLCAIACKAQTDETKLQVIYNAYYLQYVEDDSLSRDIAQLDIGTNTSRYYSKVSEWYVFNPVGKAPYPGTKIKNEEVYKNMPNKGLVTAMHWPYWITTQDSINHLFDWQLVEGDSIVCGYPCHKAQTTFRGRTWTAWYTLDLSYNDGPWKLCGLPGLILYAQDSTRQFIFDCTCIEKGDGHTFSYPSSKRIQLVTPEKAEKLLLFEAADNDAYVYAMSGARVTARIDAKGRHYKWTPKTAVPYEIFPQNHKKKNKTNPRSRKKK